MSPRKCSECEYECAPRKSMCLVHYTNERYRFIKYILDRVEYIMHPALDGPEWELTALYQVLNQNEAYKRTFMQYTRRTNHTNRMMSRLHRAKQILDPVLHQDAIVLL